MKRFIRYTYRFAPAIAFAAVAASRPGVGPRIVNRVVGW